MLGCRSLLGQPLGLRILWQPLLTIFVLFLATPAQADKQDGFDAFFDGDYATAYEELLPHAEEGDAKAQAMIGYMFHMRHILPSYEGLLMTVVPTDYDAAAMWYRRAADQGQRAAQFFLGTLYLWGNGVAQDYGEAARLFRLSAEQDVRWAQHELGDIYAGGLGVPRDIDEAVSWYRLAADQNHTPSLTALGLLYLDGDGVAMDAYSAFDFLHRAAEAGDEVAQYRLGLILMEGEGASADLSAAANWFLAAAEQRHRDAMYQLGLLYYDGRGVAKDLAAAATWYYAAMRSGHEDAKARYARMRLDGKGVSLNFCEARDLSRKLANRDNATAQLNIGLVYLHGWCVLPSLTDAYMWLSLAAQQGEEAAPDWLGLAIDMMTPEQIDEGERLVQNWLTRYD